MGKSINVHEACVITKDDKGNLSLVGKAKEALTSLDKHKVAIHIKLCDSKKDDVEKFLQENNVPFTSITAKGESPEGKDEKGEKKNDSTVTVVPRSKFVTLDGDWSWCLDSIVQRLWGEKKRRIRRVSSSAWMTAWLITYAGQHQRKKNQRMHLVLLSDNIAPTSSTLNTQMIH